MGFLAPAIPWLVKGGAALAGGLFGRGAEKAAAKRSPEEQQALAGQQGTAGQLQQIGQQATALGLPAASKAISYYQSLLGGNRAQMALTTAAPRAALTASYRGAANNLDRSGIAGASRLRAEAELNRDRAASIAGLTTGVQPAAAENLAQTGFQMAGIGNNATSNAGSIWGNLLSQGSANRAYARKEGGDAGHEIGGLIFDILSGGKGGSKSYIRDDVNNVARGIYG